ncbi:MAG: tetratricopeptide repeat protein [Endomicrobium sp.]|nr:tetratricopeptide repeat protein [Endomicrobium sp.]
MKKITASLAALFCFLPYAYANTQVLEEALTFLNDGKTDEAVSAVKTEILEEPDSAENYMALGMIHLEKNDYGSAKENLQKALSINKKIVAAHYMLAMIYEKEGDIEAALQKWGRIIKYTKNESLKSLAEKHLKQLKDGRND